MIPLWTAMSASESRPSRFRSVSVSLAGVVGVLAAVVAGATIWLMLTDPITVAEAIDTGEVAPLVEELADVIYNAIVGPPCDKLPDDLGVKESTLLAVLAGVFVIGIAPLAEEFFFRGFLFQAMRESWGVWLAAPASGLIFGAVHFQADKLVPLAILGTALGCLGLAVVAVADDEDLAHPTVIGRLDRQRQPVDHDLVARLGDAPDAVIDEPTDRVVLVGVLEP